jgi:hypothetical protein
MWTFRSFRLVVVLLPLLSGVGLGNSHAQSTPVRWIPESGWYGEFVQAVAGNAMGDRGRGVYLETQGDIAVLTIMTYEPDGRPVMLYAAGPLRFEGGCIGMSAATSVQFQSCLRNVDLYRVSGGVPLGQRGVPTQPARMAELVGRINMDASLGLIRLEIRPPTPPMQPLPPGTWPDTMGLQRLQWGYGGFGGNFPVGTQVSGIGFPGPGGCIPDFRGDWVLVEPANRGREAQRLVFDQVEQVVPNFNCGLVATPEDAARIFVVFRDTQRQVELRCRASGCGYWEQGTYSGWVERGYGLKRFQVAVGVPDGGLIPTTPLSFRAGRLVAYRVE